MIVETIFHQKINIKIVDW